MSAESNLILSSMDRAFDAGFKAALRTLSDAEALNYITTKTNIGARLLSDFTNCSAKNYKAQMFAEALRDVQLGAKEE